MKVKIIFITIIAMLLCIDTSLANDKANYRIILNDERTIFVERVDFEKDSMIIFTDINNLERKIKISEISIIKKFNTPDEILDCIVKNDGSKVCGHILEYKPGDFISLQSTENETIFFTVVSVRELILIDKPSKSIFSSNYFEVGTNLGFPAALNTYAAYWYGAIGLSVSGMYIYLADGVQLNAGFKVYDDVNKRHSFSLVGGISNIRKDKYGSGGVLRNFHWEYLGLTYNLFYFGFYGEFGFSTGHGNYKDLQPIFQFGYVHRII
ncbi:hypothetical protein ACFLSQ_02635 [Bacteroidota bacterium]